MSNENNENNKNDIEEPHLIFGVLVILVVLALAAFIVKPAMSKGNYNSSDILENTEGSKLFNFLEEKLNE